MNKVYISFKKKSEVAERKITVGDVASVWCMDKNTLAAVKNLCIIRVPEGKKHRFVISALKIISLMEQNIKDIEIENIGETELIVTYNAASSENPVTEFLKVAVIAVIMFCGGAFAIMAYGNDVDVNGIFEKMNEWTEGEKAGLYIQQAAYSVGLTSGIIVFYNHFGKKKQLKDPTPIEIQMRLYEDDVNTAIITNSERNGGTDDVD